MSAWWYVTESLPVHTGWTLVPGWQCGDAVHCMQLWEENERGSLVLMDVDAGAHLHVHYVTMCRKTKTEDDGYTVNKLDERN